ncbi:MAG: hypothetical protein AB1333_03855 [Patescibacteria group bacterium]
MKQEKRNCQNCKGEFIVEDEDFQFYKKIEVPPPTFCPDCRIQRRLSYKNERTLYRRTCDKCKKNIISIFPTDVKFPVYCPQCWYADDWGAEEYGMEYDSSKTFFVQFKELMDRVPRMSVYIDLGRTINSEYLHLTGPAKDCYLVFLADQNENCMYSYSIFYNKDLVDATKVSSTTRGYELINCENCYQTTYSSDCKNCVDTAFSKNCNNCTNCFGCVNLSNKKFCFFNEQLSEAEYKVRTSEFFSGSFVKTIEAEKRSAEFFKDFPVKYMHGNMNTNVSGDYIFQSKNVKNSFQVVGGTDNKYCQTLNMEPTSDSYDYSDWGNNATLMYDSVNCGEYITRTKFTYGAWLGGDYEYCDVCIDSHNLFGCIMLKKKKYCILNRQYTKEEYEKLRAEIIKEMNERPYKDVKGRIYSYGEFFPSELSPYPYKDTAAFEYFPLTDNEIKNNGYVWREEDVREYMPTMKWSDLPDNINDVSDDILKEIIECAHTKDGCNDRCATAFRITPQELQFYKIMKLPLPRFCYNCRHYRRFRAMNPWKLWKRNCAKCGAQIETSYSPERGETIYCEPCYQKEVI